MDETTTLRIQLTQLTPEHLGPEADRVDLDAYKEAFTRAWAEKFGAATQVDIDAARLLGDAVLEGRAGRDSKRRDWVEVASSRR